MSIKPRIPTLDLTGVREKYESRLPTPPSRNRWRPSASSSSDPELSGYLHTPPRGKNYLPPPHKNDAETRAALVALNKLKNPTPQGDDSPSQSRLYSRNSAPDTVFENRDSPSGTPRVSISNRVTFSIDNSPSDHRSFLSRFLGSKQHLAASDPTSPQDTHSDAVLRDDNDSKEDLEDSTELQTTPRPKPEKEEPATDEEIDLFRQAVKKLRGITPLYYGPKRKQELARVKEENEKLLRKIINYQSDLHLAWCFGIFAGTSNAKAKAVQNEVITNIVNRRLKNLAKLSKKFLEDYEKCDSGFKKECKKRSEKKLKRDKLLLLQDKHMSVLQRKDDLVKEFRKAIKEDAKGYFDAIEPLKNGYKKSALKNKARRSGTSSAPDLENTYARQTPAPKSGTPHVPQISPRDREDLLRVYDQYIRVYK